MKASKVSAATVARVGVLAALSMILYVFPEIPIFGFYKLDFSNLPVLLGGFAMGPLAGSVILLLKDVSGMTHSSTAFVGELADFLMGLALLMPAALLYQKRRTFKSALLGMGIGCVLMTAAGALTNYYILIPFYMNVKGFPEAAIYQSVSQGNWLAPKNLSQLIVYIVIPFNVIKSTAVTAVTCLVYKRVSPLLKGRKESHEPDRVV